MLRSPSPVSCAASSSPWSPTTTAQCASASTAARATTARSGSDAGDEDGVIEIDAEAYLGCRGPRARERGASCTRYGSSPGSPTRSTLLERWADWAGAAAGARTGAPYQVGWCSWYQYFHAVTEADIRHNLARAADWPIDVFQVDDGYQAEIGDWLERNDTFPSPLEQLAADIDARRLRARASGSRRSSRRRRLGSRIDNPDWIARHDAERELVGMVNPGWGGAVWTPRHDAPRRARPPRTTRAHARRRWAGAT